MKRISAVLRGIGSLGQGLFHPGTVFIDLVHHLEGNLKGSSPFMAGNKRVGAIADVCDKIF